MKCSPTASSRRQDNGQPEDRAEPGLTTMAEKILDTVHETARDLHEAGVMDTRTMREFDALCLQPVKTLSAAQIKRLRTRLRVSQAVFAAYLNTSPSTVQKWERGEKKPNAPSLKLLNLVEQKGLDVLE
jgi:putative transcriptional regulator